MIEIGDDVTMAPRVHILCHDTSTKTFLNYTKVGRVTIGDRVFIGAESVVLLGVTIGNDVIIGANSTVTHDIPSNSVAVGSPARVICSLDEYLEKESKRMKDSPVYDEGYTRQFVGDNGVNPLRFLFYLIVPITAFIKRKEFQPYIEKNSYLAIAVNMSVVGTAIMFVGIFSSGILIGRLPIYATIFNTILIPYIIICCFKEDERRIVKFIVIAIYLAAFMLEPNVSLYNSEKLNLIVDGYKVGSFFKSY